MAVIINPILPDILTNGQTADATQVMANFAAIISQVNAGAAENGVNASITQLTGLTTALSTAQGGTGLATPAQYAVLLGGAVAAAMSVAAPVAAGYVLTDNGPAANPSFQAIAVTSAEIITGLGFVPVKNLSPAGNAIGLGWIPSQGGVSMSVDSTTLGYPLVAENGPAVNAGVYAVNAGINALSGLYDESQRVWSPVNFQPFTFFGIGCIAVFNNQAGTPGTIFTPAGTGGSWLCLGQWQAAGSISTAMCIRIS
jgi:hypothetical protein